jgi:hypothetical protein
MYHAFSSRFGLSGAALTAALFAVSGCAARSK